jgi:hypothetical protein
MAYASEADRVQWSEQSTITGHFARVYVNSIADTLNKTTCASTPESGAKIGSHREKGFGLRRH